MVSLLCVVALVACEGERDEVDARFGGKTWESQHYRYRYQADDPMACEGVLDSLETYGGLVADLLGVKGDEWTRSSVYKYPSREAFEDAEVCRTKTVHSPSSTLASATTARTCAVISCRPCPGVAIVSSRTIAVSLARRRGPLAARRTALERGLIGDRERQRKLAPTGWMR